MNCPVEKWVQAVGGTKETYPGMSLKFQVTDVKKPLIAVRRITEQGNHVNFGPGREDEFIEN